MMRKTTIRAGILSGLLFCGCNGGPEVVPHQPIDGVDTEENKVDNPHDKRGSASLRSRARTPDETFLDEFLVSVAAAVRNAPGRVTVFPALSPIPDTDAMHVNGLGEFLMEETASGLASKGVKNVSSGASLKNDMLAKGKGPADLWAAEDIYPLGKLVEADYVIFGRVERHVFDRIKRDEVLKIDWRCERMKDHTTVAAYRQNLTGALAARLYRYYQLDSDWSRVDRSRVGAGKDAAGKANLEPRS